MIPWILMAMASGSIGAATSSWFEGTKTGTWLFLQVNKLANWASARYGIDILRPDEYKFRKKYPHLDKYIKELEQKAWIHEKQLKRLEERVSFLEKRPFDDDGK